MSLRKIRDVKIQCSLQNLLLAEESSKSHDFQKASTSGVVKPFAKTVQQLRSRRKTYRKSPVRKIPSPTTLIETEIKKTNSTSPGFPKSILKNGTKFGKNKSQFQTVVAQDDFDIIKNSVLTELRAAANLRSKSDYVRPDSPKQAPQSPKNKLSPLQEVRIQLPESSQNSQLQQPNKNKCYLEMLVDRNLMNTNKYVKPATSSYKCANCQKHQCPPRLIQMAVPKKRHVLENWKAYQNQLPPEKLLRFEQILQDKTVTNDVEQIAEQPKEDRKWLKEETKKTVDDVMKHIQKAPWYLSDFKQLVISDQILGSLQKQNLIENKARTTKDVFDRTLIEICDKLATKVDDLSKSMTMQRPQYPEEEIPILQKSFFTNLLEENVDPDETEESEDDEFDEFTSESESVCEFEEIT